MQEHPILIGKTGRNYHHFHGSEHGALYAKTGSGKSSSFVIPNCFSWRGSLVVLDVKGEAFRATAGYRSRVLGQDVYVFDPAAEDERSHRWNPLQPVQRDSVNRFDQISRQAFMLFPEAASGSTSNADAFWTPSARGAFTAVATLLCETPGRRFDMAEVLRCFARGDSQQVLANMIKQRRVSGDPGYSQIAVDGASDYLNGSPDQVGGIRKMTSTRLQSWFNPRIAAATAASDFDLRDIRRVLDELEAVEIALSSMIRRREDHISEELRVEIMMQAYEPVLHILIRTERRGHKRLGWRKVEPAD
jgi:type IV secretion system protein VirD4